MLGVGRKDVRHILIQATILADGGVGDLEAFFLRMKSDADADRLVVLGQHLTAKRAAIRAVTRCCPSIRMRLPAAGAAVLELHGRVAPGDQVADRVALVERVQEVANLGGFPDEGSLDLGDGDLARLHPGQQGFDGVWRDGTTLEVFLDKTSRRWGR
jgi:hypothetical protein